MSEASIQEHVSVESLVARVADEFMERHKRGERPDVEEYAARHPQAAELLRKVLAALDVVGVSLAAAASSGPACEGEVAGTLGDFRILREVGRGGMGIVYEAQQISLKRRVALKVLPFAGTLDPKQLQRFHNEAQAAAGLHHTNIVPVHFVGCERGVHFYAMQFIDGQTLAEVLRQLRQPPADPQSAADPQPTTLYGAAGVTTRSVDSAPVRRAEHRRWVARLGEQAAEALHHAHELGVIHRDVKPGNLMLDGRGNLWVTDFGLAHVQSDASLTASGDLVGTLRYMSPEQALAKRVLIDQRTDVYSLGATLFELLTLRPPFDGADRQELLRQIAFEEPEAPRRLDKAIPAELETIVLKALEKNPADRYATAQELADDLRRFLDDRPIKARRPSWRQVAAKWARRHRGVACAGAAMLGMLLVLGAGFGVWRMQQRAVAQAQAEQALADADRFQAEGKWPEALLAARRAEPLLSAGLLNDGLRQRVQERVADLAMVDRLEQIRLQKAVVKGTDFDRAQADSAYAQAFRDYGIDVAVLGAAEAAGAIRARGIRVELAAALDDWAVVCRGTRDKADTTWKDLLGLARAADPDELRNRLRDALESKDAPDLKGLAATGGLTGLPPSTLVLLGDTLGHTGAVKEAVAVLHQGQRLYPGNFWINFTLAYWLARRGPGHQEDVLCYTKVAVALRPLSAAAHNDLARALERKGQLDEAIAEYREALRLNKDYSYAQNNLGIALHNNGRPDEAIAEFREALRLNKDHAQVHYNLGHALQDKGQLDEAITEYREAVRLHKDFPAAHSNLGAALADMGRLDEAIAEYREAIRLNKDEPLPHNGLGNALKAKGQLEEAIAEFHEAIQLDKHYPEAHSNLGAALAGMGRLDEAIAEHREAIRLQKDFPGAHCNLGNALKAKGQLEEAIAEYREAIRLRKDFHLAHCTLGLALMQKGQFQQAVQELRLGHELGSKKPYWLYPSAQALRDAERLADLDARLPALLAGQEQPKDAGQCLALAQLCQLHKQLFVAATRWYAEAFAAEPGAAADLDAAHRYNAACAAVLAGCGQGKDASGLGDKERAGLRRQALDWLRADLDAWRKVLEKGADQARLAVVQQMQHWQQDSDFTGVRGPDTLDRLLEAERRDWRRLWADVADTLARAQGKSDSDKKAPTK
jgi:serine/threonine protein kinase/Flp pilus assembly protein TadD